MERVRRYRTVVFKVRASFSESVEVLVKNADSPSFVGEALSPSFVGEALESTCLTSFPGILGHTDTGEPNR